MVVDRRSSRSTRSAVSLTRLSIYVMSSILQPTSSLVNRSNSSISGCRRRNLFSIRFGYNDLPIGVNEYPRAVDRRLNPGGENLAWIWSRRQRVVLSEYGGFEGIKDDEDENGEDRSVEFLVRFLQNVFKKITSKARKAVRSVLPLSIATELVCFSVDGVTMLAFLWLAKACLEVICTVGSVVFISILLIRGIWYGITCVQESGTDSLNVPRDEQLWSKARRAM